MWPTVGCSKPAIIRSRVVFPHPEGPSSERNSPSRTDRSIFSMAVFSPKLFFTLWMLRCSIGEGSDVMMAFQRCSGWQWSTGALGDVEDDAAVADGQFVGHGADLGRDVGVAGGPVAGVVADDGVHPRRDAEAVEVGLARAQSGAARRIVGGRDVGSDEVDGRLVQAAGRFAGLIADDDSALRIRGGGVDAGE